MTQTMFSLFQKDHAYSIKMDTVEGVLQNPTAGKAVHYPPEEVISAGKNTYVYDAHTYHTKVPPEGIENLIEYFTQEGDVVLDPFCGSGMTGVAALRKQRKVILSDLSPAAIFISRNFCTNIDSERYISEIRRILDGASELNSKLYGTQCRRCNKNVEISYCVWSYRTRCNRCNHIFPIWETARYEAATVRDSKILSDFACPKCKSMVYGRIAERIDRIPVQIGYTCCEGGRSEQKVDPTEIDTEKANYTFDKIPDDLWYPNDYLPLGDSTKQAINHGIDAVHKLYSGRNLHAMAYLWSEAKKIEDPAMRDKIMYTVTSLYQRVTNLSEFRFWGGSSNSANYNVPKISNEQNVFQAFERKAKTIELYLRDTGITDGLANIEVGSATDLSRIPDESIDYVFCDPPFGSYINYSEMNFIWESWLRDKTATEKEAIINKSQNKGISEYENLILQSLQEINRVLKNGSWATIMFHNSSKKVLNALRNSISHSGLAIKGVQIFDKKQGTTKMFTSQNSTGYDLLIHCRKNDHSKNRIVADGDVLKFISNILLHKDGYAKEYIHVDRESELDTRRMYSEWIAICFINSFDVIDFADFNLAVDAIRSKK